MTEKPVLTREDMKASYPNQWLLVTDFELDPATSLRKGRVLAHSRDRGEIHRPLRSIRETSAFISPAAFLGIPGSYSHGPSDL